MSMNCTELCQVQFHWCFFLLCSQQEEKVDNCTSSPTQKTTMVKQVREKSITLLTPALAGHPPSFSVPSWKPPCFIRCDSSLRFSAPVVPYITSARGLGSLLHTQFCYFASHLEFFNVCPRKEKNSFKSDLCLFFPFLDPDINDWLPKKIIFMS